MNLSDITKINFGAANISAVYNGGIKLWPKGSEVSNKVMKFTIVSGDTWNNTGISAYTADNRLIEPVKRDATGWTYDEEVGYIKGAYNYSKYYNLLTFEGFPKSVKLKTGYYLFNKNSRCTDISTANIDVSECKDMTYMFKECGSLTTLDLSNWDTSQVTDMANMFFYCKNLASINFSNWNTSKVTNMYSMFYNCSALTSLDLSNWDVSQLMGMGSMFYNCSKLNSLNLSNWNILQNEIVMGSMFSGCSALKTVKMTNCSQATVDKIRAALDEAGLTNTVITE